MKSKAIEVKDMVVGEVTHGLYLVKNIKKNVTVQGKEYMDIEIGDKTGSVVGKMWEISYESEQLEVGNIAYATGQVTEWQGAKQVKLDYIEAQKGEHDVTEYIISAPYTSAEMDGAVVRFIEGMTDTEIQSVVGHLYEENRKQFLEVPAAFRMHHAIHGGLAYHTITMLKVAEKLLDVYTFLNKDLLYAGIILHDLAKVDEMSSVNGVATEYTRGGHLLGHIVQGTMMIERVANELSIDERTKEVLQHMVVSHHDKGEWGSPQPPRIPEAVMLHHIDNIDAKMFMVKELIDDKPEGEYTNYHKGLGNKLLIY